MLRLGGVASCYGVRAFSEVIDTATSELFPHARFHEYDEALAPQHIESAVNKMLTIFRHQKCIIFSRSCV